MPHVHTHHSHRCPLHGKASTVLRAAFVDTTVATSDQQQLPTTAAVASPSYSKQYDSIFGGADGPAAIAASRPMVPGIPSLLDLRKQLPKPSRAEQASEPDAEQVVFSDVHAVPKVRTVDKDHLGEQ